ncbi:hypothetical protein B0H12DRAFT_1143176 [Mycena haematopus]|nr:hypothetical protein B0H12DRAFT_1143176 [Mycena haematopus]
MRTKYGRYPQRSVCSLILTMPALGSTNLRPGILDIMRRSDHGLFQYIILLDVYRSIEFKHDEKYYFIFVTFMIHPRLLICEGP